MIEFEGVSYTYSKKEGATPALSDISLSIADGEFVGILGANGSGKSTLAKLMNCLLVPTVGKVRVCGFDTSDHANVWAVRRRVGFVFQNPENQIVGTLVENDVAFAPENLGLPVGEIEERVAFALDAVELSHRRRFLTANLSGGQKQRLAIAGVLAMRPRVLVLDEPTAMLDARGRENVIRLIMKINRDLGITVVLITHFMENALLCDRIVCLSSGRAGYDGPPADFFRRGAKFVSEFNLRMPFGYELLSRLAERGHAVPPSAWERAHDLEALSAALAGPECHSGL